MFKKDTGSAMKASTAYQDIIDAIHEAHDAARNASLAADMAYEKVEIYKIYIMNFCNNYYKEV